MPLGAARQRADPGEKLLHELNAHLEAVQEIYERVIHAQRPIYYSLPPRRCRAGSRERRQLSNPRPAT